MLKEAKPTPAARLAATWPVACQEALKALKKVPLRVQKGLL